MHLGFTFSFPVEQTAIDAGKLLTWTKGFNAKNAIGKDVVRLLQDAFDRKHIHVRCSALVNDVSGMRVSGMMANPQTVGTLLSRSYQNGPALIGAIFGTGTNGAYIDHTRTLSKIGKDKIAEAEAGGEHAGQYMVVNTEWGAMDNDVGRRSITTDTAYASDTSYPSPSSTTSSTVKVSTRAFSPEGRVNMY